MKRVPSHYPTFVVIGAMRSATTSLHSYLNGHPEIFMSAIKGSAIYIDPNSPIRYPSKYSSMREKRGGLEETELLAKMRHGYAGQAHFGESTDLYTRYPVVDSNTPEKMIDTNPDMLLIYVLRNPLARLLSQFKVERTRPHNTAAKTLSRYLANGADAVDSSRYCFQIRRYLQQGFEISQILPIVFEEFIQEPDRHMRVIARFLNIEPHEMPGFPHLNQGPECPEPALSSELYRILINRLQADISALQELFGRSIPAWDLSEDTWCAGSAC